MLPPRVPLLLGPAPTMAPDIAMRNLLGLLSFAESSDEPIKASTFTEETRSEFRAAWTVAQSITGATTPFPLLDDPRSAIDVVADVKRMLEALAVRAASPAKWYTRPAPLAVLGVTACAAMAAGYVIAKKF